MGWTLDQDLFRYLIGLYAASLIVAIACLVYESFGPGWDAFSEEFELLADQHFGRESDSALMIALSLALLALGWHLATLVGLRKFRPWARWGFWTSMILATVVVYGAQGLRPSFTGPFSSIVAEVGTGLFAAILLLSYSTDHGAVWFRKPLETLKETF